MDNIDQKLETLHREMQIDPQKSYRELLEIEALITKHTKEIHIKRIRLYKAQCLLSLSKFVEGIKILADLSEEPDIEKPTVENFTIFNSLGVAYTYMGENTKAFQYYSKSLELSRTGKLVEKEIMVLNNMGTYYLNLKDNDQALIHFKKIRSNGKFKDLPPELKSMVLANIAIAYINMKQFTEAEKWMIECIDLSKSINSTITYIENLRDMAEIKIGLKDERVARENINEALKICLETGNKRLECELLLMLGEIDKDVKHFKKVYAISLELLYKPIHTDTCLKLSRYYEKIGQFETSLTYIKEHYAYEKEMNNLAAKKKLRNMEMEFEIDKNRKEAAIFKSKNMELKELYDLISQEKKELEAAYTKIRELAARDELTGLLNRRLFFERLEEAIALSDRTGEKIAVLFIDLDNFKPINDTWGHDIGDKVLIEISNRFTSSVRKTDVVARFGGDEFMILLFPIRSKSDTKKVAEKIIRQVCQPLIFKEVDRELKIGLSIGISVYSGKKITAEKLISQADNAMYIIKKKGKNGIEFS